MRLNMSCTIKIFDAGFAMKMHNGKFSTTMLCDGSWLAGMTSDGKNFHISGKLRILIGTCCQDQSGTALKYKETNEVAMFYKEMLEAESGTDLKIEAGNGTTISCHKFILQGN